MSGNQWLHSICDHCWQEFEGDRRPHRLIERNKEFCCICGKRHCSGIYLHKDPKMLPCKGMHI
jgi:hypothetical protein